MKASRFSDAQKAFILKQGADGMPVADVCRKAGISQATYFNWKRKYDGLLPTEMRRLKQLEDRRNATRPNETWAMDFVHDELATGRKLRVLTIVDTFSRFSPALEPRFSFRGTDVVEVLERVGREIGLPAAIRVDQGTEFVSRDLDLWAYQRGVTLDFSRPGKPTDNAFIEAFNGRFRAECLSEATSGVFLPCITRRA